MAADPVAIENRLGAAELLWANVGLKPAEFSTPVRSRVSPRCADKRCAKLSQILHEQGAPIEGASLRRVTQYGFTC